jgi:hypothetical protein
MNIVKVEGQHDFPNCDLTRDNAALLELMMQNWDVITSSHESAEGARILFRLGHVSLLKIAKPHLDSKDLLDAFSHGITTYEAMSAMAQPCVHSEFNTNAALQVITTQSELENDFTGTLTDACDQFRDELPRASNVIGVSATRFCRQGIDYALAGAAIARQLEVNARS